MSGNSYAAFGGCGCSPLRGSAFPSLRSACGLASLAAPLGRLRRRRFACVARGLALLAAFGGCGRSASAPPRRSPPRACPRLFPSALPPAPSASLRSASVRGLGGGRRRSLRVPPRARSLSLSVGLTLVRRSVGWPCSTRLCVRVRRCGGRARAPLRRATLVLAATAFLPPFSPCGQRSRFGCVRSCRPCSVLAPAVLKKVRGVGSARPASLRHFAAAGVRSLRPRGREPLVLGCAPSSGAPAGRHSVGRCAQLKCTVFPSCRGRARPRRGPAFGCSLFARALSRPPRALGRFYRSSDKSPRRVPSALAIRSRRPQRGWLRLPRRVPSSVAIRALRARRGALRVPLGVSVFLGRRLCCRLAAAGGFLLAAWSALRGSGF